MNILGDKLQQVFKNLRGYGKLSESNVADALKEVRLALIAADVNYKVAKEFCQRVKEKSLGEEVQKSIRPGELFVKIVHDELISLFGRSDRDLNSKRPLRIAMCGLNGAGKTTTAAKLANHFKKSGESVLLVAGDLSRPAAIQQLEILGKQIGVSVKTPQENDKLADHLKRVEQTAKEGEERIIIYDLAGRMEIDEELLAELKEGVSLIQPDETLLVADAAMGQKSGEVATGFSETVNLTGIVLSKFDGDARGGAAFALQTISDCPIKFLGTGERVDQFEVFQPERLVKRLLGMGDLMGLVEKVQEEIDLNDAAKLEEKLKKQNFDLQDFLDQMKQIKKLGPLKNLLGMIPGMSSIPDSALDEGALKKTEAIIYSMTVLERRRPEIIKGSRRLRIANGSGTSIFEVNQLLKQFKGMKKMMSKLTKGGNPEGKLKRMFSGRGF